jgi:hypothetical protein
MPLAKVQLMEAPGGPGITGAVKAGPGINISADGTISASGTPAVTSTIQQLSQQLQDLQTAFNNYVATHP